MMSWYIDIRRIFLTTAKLYWRLVMCSSDRVLEYSAVTVMIDHENDDRGEKNLIGYSSTLGGHPELWFFSLPKACSSKYRREKREKLISKSRSDVWFSYMDSLATLLVHLASTGLDPLLPSELPLILCGIDSTRCWKYSSEILVHIDMIASRCCCIFVGCTSIMRISRSTTYQRCSVRWNLVTVEAIWVKFKKPVWDDFSFVALSQRLHYSAESIRRWVHCSPKVMDMRQ